MPMIEIKAEPSTTDLRVFALAWLAFFLILGWLAGGSGLAIAAGVTGVCVLISLLFNRERSRKSQATALAFPIGLLGLWSVGLVEDEASRDRLQAMVFGAMLTIGVTGCVLSLALRAVARRLYRVWMNAGVPIGWTIAHAVLGVGFFGVIMPIGLVMKLLGHDPMNRSFDRKAETYWTRHEQVKDAKRYFRQF